MSASLPEYMIPSMFVPVESFPLTPNNKIDRKALASMDVSGFVSRKSYAKPETEIEKQITDIWKRLLGISGIGIDDNFFELGGHSILAVEMFAEIEKITGKKIPLVTLFNSQTIRQLADLLNDEEWVPDWSPLVEIKKGKYNTSLFLIHGAEGNILLYRELASHLDPNLPVYGLQSRGLNGKGHIPVSIEEMASDYLKAIKKIQPAGPYFLGGYCMGGTIAFELAQQLKLAGDTVKILFMLETYNVCVAPNVDSLIEKTKFNLENLKFHFDNFKSLHGTERSKFLKQKTEVAKWRLGIKINSVASKFGMGQSDAVTTVREANDFAQLHYKPQKYDGKVVLLKPVKSYSSEPDINFGWSEYLTGEFKVYNLNLAPRGMLVEPFVEETAQIVSKEIDKCSSLEEVTVKNANN